MVVEQRADAGIGPLDVVRGHRDFEIFARRFAEIGNFALADLRRTFGIAPRFVGRADQRMVAFIGNGENDAAILVLENIAVVAFIFAFDDNVAALDQTQLGRVAAAVVQRGHRVDPGAGGVDQHLRLLGPCLAMLADMEIPVIGTAIQSGAFRTSPDIGAAIGCVTGGERYQPGILNPAIGIGKSLFQALLQRIAAMIPEQIEALRRRKDVAPAEVIVEEQAETQQPGRTHAFVDRQHEAHRPDDMRGRAQQHLAFLERLAHEVEFIMFEIAQAAVHQFCAGRGGMGGEIVALHQQDPEPPARGIARNSDAIYAAADNGQIIHGRCHKVPCD